MAPFDPYHKWLGIPPQEQPASYYRLLGIANFEVDADVIETAAERQTLLLRTFQTGPNSELAERLLNEISAARVCLLDGKSKARYDTQLRAALEPAPEDDPLAFTTEELAAVSSKPATRSRSQGGKPFWQEPWAIPAAAGGIVVVLLLLMMLFGSGEEPKESRQGKEQELQAEIASLKEKLVAAEGAKNTGSRERIKDAEEGMIPVDGVFLSLVNCAKNVEELALAGVVDVEKDWRLSFEFKVPQLVDTGQALVVWGDSRPGRDVIVVSVKAQTISGWVQDCHENSPHYWKHNLRDSLVGRWVPVVVEFESGPGKLRVTIDGEITHEKVVVSRPKLDRPAPFRIGGTGDDSQRFRGTIRRFSFSNIPPVNKEPKTETTLLPPSLSEGLIAYYPFNGNANDESGNGHDGTVHGATLTQDRHDNANRAYLFNEGAEKSNVVVPDHDLLDLGNSSNKEMTISLWCSLPKHKAAQLIVKGKGHSPVTDYCFLFPSTTAEQNILFWGTGRADTHSGSWPPTYLPNLSTDWHHFVAIYKQGKGIDGYKKVYLDGQLIYLGPSGAKNKSNSEDLLIGGGPWTAKQKYLGHRVDDVRIYNRALSEQEVRQLYEFESRTATEEHTSPYYFNHVAPIDVGALRFHFDSEKHPLRVNGKRSRHGFLLHPRGAADDGLIRTREGIVTYRKPPDYQFLAGAVAILDDALTPELIPLTFSLKVDDAVVWKSGPIKTSQQVAGFCIELSRARELAFLVNSQSAGFNNAVWLDPVLMKSTDGKSLEQIAKEQQARWLKKED